MERKVKLKAYVSEDHPRKYFSNFGYTFYRGEYVDLNKPPKALLDWIEQNEFITIKEVPVGPLTSEASGRIIQIDIVPAMGVIALERELKAAGYESKMYDSMDDDERREKLKELMIAENKELHASIQKEELTIVPADPTGPSSEDTDIIEPTWTNKDIESAEYKELRKAAKAMNVSAKGKKETLRKRILKRMSE